MDLYAVWEYFGNFDHNKAESILAFGMVLVGTPLLVGITAKLWVWAIKQVRTACQCVRRYNQKSLMGG